MHLTLYRLNDQDVFQRVEKLQHVLNSEHVMSAQSIIEELQHVETAFEKLLDVYDLDHNRFPRAQDRLRFQARKQEYKKLRDDAWRWLNNHSVTPQQRQDLERGDDTTADNPFRWSVHASFVRGELQRALQRTLPISSQAQNVSLIHL